MRFKDLLKGDTFILKPGWFMREHCFVVMQKDYDTKNWERPHTAHRLVDKAPEHVNPDAKVIRVIVKNV